MTQFNKEEYIIFSVIITCCFLFHFDGLGYTIGSTWQRLTYSFAHAGLAHLFVNLISFLSLSLPLQRTPYIPLAFVCAVAATFGTELYLPTVGLSGVCYALLGFHAILSGRVLKIALSAAAYNGLLWLVSDRINIGVHILSFVYALIIAYIAESGINKKSMKQLYHRI